MEEKEKKLRAAIYIRVSTQDQQEKFGPDLQLSKIKSLLEARSNSLEFAGDEYLYRDLGVSGADEIDKRPELSRMLEDLEYAGEDRPFDTVVVFKIDRFARKLSVLLDITERFKTYGVGFISTQESIDTNTALGTAMLGIMGVFAELEREMIMERTEGGLEEFKKGGGWVQDKYGYRRDNSKYKRPTLYEPEASIIREIYEMFVYQKMSIFSICTTLRDRSVLIPTFSKKQKLGDNAPEERYNRTDHTVRKILSDEIYVGKYYYNKTKTVTDRKAGTKKQVAMPKAERIVSPFTHMPIVSDELFDKAKKLLDQKGHYSKSGSTYILTGLLRCDACKTHRSRGMLERVGKTSAGKFSYYQCSGKSSENEHICHTMPLPKEDLERLVLHEVKSIFNNPAAIDRFVDQFYGRKQGREKFEKQLNQLYLEQAKYERGLENITEMSATGEIELQDARIHSRRTKELLKVVNESIVSTKNQMRKIVDKEKYKTGFALIKDNIGSPIDDILADPEKCKKFLSYIIQEIIIFSRPKTKGEVTAGKKKESQLIANKIHIKFRLPQEFMDLFLYKGH